MTINKFQGKTEEEAIEKAKQEMGENVVIMNVKTIKPKGVASLFKKTIYEVTAAKEETEQVNPVAAFNSPMKMHEQINLAADDPIQMPPYERKETEQPTVKKDMQQTIQVEIAKQEQNSSTQVRHANDTSNDGEGFDAREQGKNRYRKQKGGKGKAEKKEDGKVIAKSAKGGFDIKI